MDKDDDLFNFCEDIKQNDSKLNTVLTDIFHSSSSKSHKDVEKPVCTNNLGCVNRIRLHNTYKKFIYPSKEDIIKEMYDTVNLNVNRSKKVQDNLKDDDLINTSFSMSQFDDEFSQITQGVQSLDKSSVILKNESTLFHLNVSTVDECNTSGRYSNMNNTELVSSDRDGRIDHVKELVDIDSSLYLQSEGILISTINIHSRENEFSWSSDIEYTDSAMSRVNDSYETRKSDCLAPNNTEKVVKKMETLISSEADLVSKNINDGEIKHTKSLSNINIRNIHERETTYKKYEKKVSSDVNVSDSVSTREKLRESVDNDIFEGKSPRKIIHNSIYSKDKSKSVDEEVIMNKKGDAYANNRSLGFKSASGVGIVISEKAKEKARDLISKYENDFEEEKSVCNGINSENSREMNSKNVDDIKSIKNMGFKSASGVSIKITEFARENARKIIAQDKNKNTGFTSASGVSISISEDVREKARKRLENDLNEYEKDTDFDIVPMYDLAEPKITLEQSLPKEFNEKENNINMENQSSFHRSALNTKKIKKETSILTENNIFKCKTFERFGFKSASGVDINVPEISRLKAKSLLSKHLDEPKSVELNIELPSLSVHGNECAMVSGEADSFHDYQELNKTDLKDSICIAESFIGLSDLDVTVSDNENDKSLNNRQYKISSTNVHVSLKNEVKPIIVTPRTFNDSRNEDIFKSLPFDNVDILKDIESMNFSSDMEEFGNESSIHKSIQDQNFQVALFDGHFPISPISSKHKIVEKLKQMSSSTPLKCRAQLPDRNHRFERNNSDILQELLPVKQCSNKKILLGQFSRIRKSGGKLLSLKEFLKECHFKRLNNSNLENGQMVSFDYCESVSFKIDSGIKSMTVGDGGTITIMESGIVTSKQIFECFQSLEGVDSQLITQEWLMNHYKMVLWKLISFQHFCSSILPQNWLSPHHVMLQLKYRYDKEIDEVKRPALRRIAEQDDTAAKRLVLVVVTIRQNMSDISQVLMSDGWYCVPALIDKLMKDQIVNGKIKIGTKLITCNASWSGFDEAIVLPCTSFPPNSGLRLHGNSTRRARNYAKLGFQMNATPFPVSLGSLTPTGGMASLILVLINRVYPIQFMETIYHSNQDKPQRIFRNQRAEEVAAKSFDQLKENIINKTVEAMFMNNSSSKRQRIADLKDLRTGEDILNWVNSSMDQDSVEELLTNDQQNILRSYKEQIVTEAINTKCPNRNVISVARVLVSGLHRSDIDSKQSAMLTIWKPNDNLMAMLTEGATIKIYSLLVNHSKVDIHSTINNCHIALNTTSSTRFEQDLTVHENLVEKVFRSRQLWSISEAYRILSTMTLSCEIDCVGLVAAISKVTSLTNDCWQIIVLSDPDSQNNDIITIKLWGGIKSNYLSNVIDTGCCVKFVNLQFRTLFKSRLSSDRGPIVPECHYSQYSNVTYVNKHANFSKVRDSLNSRIKSLLPWFESDCLKSVSSLYSKSFSGSSTTPQRINKLTSYIGDHSTSNITLNPNPKLTTSTPKRLGLSSKRANKTEILDKSMNKENTCSPNHSVSNNASQNTLDDVVDMNESIADLVKTRRRAATTCSLYSPAQKKKK